MAQRLQRHRDMRTTMECYADLSLIDDARAQASAPMPANDDATRVAAAAIGAQQSVHETVRDGARRCQHAMTVK